MTQSLTDAALVLDLSHPDNAESKEGQGGDEIDLDDEEAVYRAVVGIQLPDDHGHDFMSLYEVVRRVADDQMSLVARMDRSRRLSACLLDELQHTFPVSPSSRNAAILRLADNYEFTRGALRGVQDHLRVRELELEREREQHEAVQLERDGLVDQNNCLAEENFMLRLRLSQANTAVERAVADAHSRQQIRATEEDRAERLAEALRLEVAEHKTLLKDQGVVLESMQGELEVARARADADARTVKAKSVLTQLAARGRSSVVAAHDDLLHDLEVFRDEFQKQTEALAVMTALKEHMSQALQDSRREVERLAAELATSKNEAHQQESTGLLKAAYQAMEAKPAAVTAQNQELRTENADISRCAQRALAEQVEVWSARVLKLEAQTRDQLQVSKRRVKQLNASLLAVKQSVRYFQGSARNLHAQLRDSVPSFWDWVRKNFSLKNGHRVEDLLSAWLADEPSLYTKHLEAVCLIFDTPSAPSLPLLEGRIFGKAPDDSTLDLPWTSDSSLGRSPTSSEDGPCGSTKVTTADEEEDEEAKSEGNVADEKEKEEAASVGAIGDRAISSRLLVKETPLSRTPTRKRATTNPPGMRSLKKPRVVMSDAGRGLPTMGLISSVEVAYQDLVRRAPWERYRTQVSFIPPSFLADPMWGGKRPWTIFGAFTLGPYGPGSRRIRRFGLRADARDKLWPEVPLRVKGQAWRAPFMPTLEFVYGRDLTSIADTRGLRRSTGKSLSLRLRSSYSVTKDV
ncbi:hypothetical protein DYB34_013178 [Aphanomyces astaci]|uniref:Uncharacterized protein n=1 Tax=Aphanomyces astaci TaxID=112090 RepID=A0A3R7AEF1_APHAT|nr:hypothetical protein DYB34_013178 [Aphanomyces astaci]